MPEELAVVGKKVPRYDAPAKATGDAKYTADIQLPRMLYGAILRSPHAHAMIKSIDTSEAEKLPGVKAVATYEDIGTTIPKISYLVPQRGPMDSYVLDPHLRYKGDEVAAIAAETLDIAEEALELIKVEYELLPSVFDAEEALKEGAPLIQPEMIPTGLVNGNLIIGKHGPDCTHSMDFGDVDKAFVEADIVLERKVTAHIQAHCTMETDATVAMWEGDKLTIWLSGQGVHLYTGALAQAFDMPIHKVRVIHPYVGGGFGGKATVKRVHGITILLAKKSGRPVKVVPGRADFAVCGMTRHLWDIYIKIGAMNDGTLTAYEAQIYSNTGAYCWEGHFIAEIGIEHTPKFSIPNRRYRTYAVYTNNPAAGAFRGFGYCEIDYAYQTVLDELIDKLGIDPLEFYLKNLVEPLEPFGAYDVSKNAYYIEIMEKAAEKLGWEEKWHKPGEKTLPNGKKHGVGLGIGGGFAGMFVSGAVVLVNEDGTVHLHSGPAELGQGPRTSAAQMCAEAIGVRYEDVSITGSDSAVTIFDTGQFASRTTMPHGLAIKMAAEDAKQQLFVIASMMLPNVTPELLDARDGFVFIKERPQVRVPISGVAVFSHWAAPGIIRTPGPYGVIVGKGFCGLPSPPGTLYGNGIADAVEVEVDTETGQVEVTRLVQAVDCGKAINPKVVEQQNDAVLSGGIGWAIAEDLTFDEENRWVLNPTFLDYKLPTALDYRNIDVIIVEPNEPAGPWGAKGIGEATISASAPALYAAVFNALGVRVPIPMTPDKILQALGKV